MPSRKSATDKFFEIMKKTRGRCYYCGDKKWPAAGTRLEITIDHLVPTILGGGDDIDNLVPCCRVCNSTKCGGSVEDLRHHVALRFAKMPKFTRDQITWMRKAGANITKYDSFKFWFELAAHKSAHRTAVLAEKINEIRA